MTEQVDVLETEMVDLLDVSLGELRRLPAEELAEVTELTLNQVQRPRYNLGSSGPPGRSD
jgi:hypothetical protein